MTAAPLTWQPVTSLAEADRLEAFLRDVVVRATAAEDGPALAAAAKAYGLTGAMLAPAEVVARAASLRLEPGTWPSVTEAHARFSSGRHALTMVEAELVDGLFRRSGLTTVVRDTARRAVPAELRERLDSARRARLEAATTPAEAIADPGNTQALAKEAEPAPAAEFAPDAATPAPEVSASPPHTTEQPSTSEETPAAVAATAAGAGEPTQAAVASSEAPPAATGEPAIVTAQPVLPADAPANATTVEVAPAPPVAPPVRRPRRAVTAEKAPPMQALAPPQRHTWSAPDWSEVVARVQGARTALPERLPELTASLGTLGDRMAFASERGANRRKFVQIDRTPTAGSVWFIGDVHGDLLGLEASLACIDALDADATVVFLGDLIDRGADPLTTVLRVLDVADRRTGRVALLSGNHDDAMGYRGDEVADAPFTTLVHPGDFPEWCNARASESPVRSFGRALVNLFRDLPRAFLFTQGVFAAHGGFPHSDLWAKLESTADLEQPAVLKDCTWNRWSDAARKLPNRFSSGCSYGVQDFWGFSEVVAQLTDVRIERIVRGHDHVVGGPERWQCDGKRWGFRALTINNLSTNADESPMLGPRQRQPTVARMLPDGRLELVVVALPPEVVDAVYPEPAKP